MRSWFASLPPLAAIVLVVAVGSSTTVSAQSVMRTCATEWKQAQSAGATGGQSWPQFLAQCRTRQGSAASPSPATAAPAPAPQSGSLFPWWQPSGQGSTASSNASAPARGSSVMKECAGQWKDAKAAGTTGGLSWPQFLSQCRSRQGSVAAAPSGGFAPAPAPAPAPTPNAQSGAQFPWWRPSSPASNAGSALGVGQYTTELQARAQCPSATVVWVNAPTGIYHYSGTRYYGQTRKGAYMCEADARAAGYRAARNRQREAEAH
jgi:hypothetical protein